jgi:hypothetical protein
LEVGRGLEKGKPVSVEVDIKVTEKPFEIEDGLNRIWPLRVEE